MKKTAPQGGALPIFLILLIFGSVDRLNAQSLPSPWKNSDVGSPSATGRASATSGKFTIEGAGQVGGATDEFHFVYQQISGDVDIAVRVNSLEDLDPWARAGVMIRDGLGARVRHAFVSMSAGRGVNFERRRAAEGDTRRTEGGAGVAPVWLRLVRSGSDFAAYRSANGTSWTPIGRATISMRATAYVGLAVTSDQPARTATAVFSNVTLHASSKLPAPWRTRDVGAIEPGDASLSGGVFTINGAGAGLLRTSDQFHYTFQAASGDIEIIARLATLAGTGAAKAGVMIRGRLGRSAVHATLLGTVRSGWEFRRRVNRADRTHRSDGPASRAPGWIRMVREGDIFSAYHSSDGVGWTLVDSDHIEMSSDVYIGLAVSSGDPSTLATATFANVLVRTPPTTNEPPEISIVSPAGGQSFPVGASIAIQASATDPDGTVAAVDFYRGSTLLASDKTSPFAATWSPATAGTHTLSAQAYDADGAVVSTSVTIVVGAAAPGTTTLLFSASADHDANVTSYSLAIYKAMDSLSAAPVTKVNLGKPKPAGGEIAVDISSLVSSLAPGTYKAVVRANNSAGSTASLPSASFGK